MKITNGIDHTKFVQLPYGISKKVYGNLLDDFSVHNYCGTFIWKKLKEQNWKLGNPKICEWKEEDLNANLPKDILNEYIIGLYYAFSRSPLKFLNPIVVVFHNF